MADRLLPRRRRTAATLIGAAALLVACSGDDDVTSTPEPAPSTAAPTPTDTGSATPPTTEPTPTLPVETPSPTPTDDGDPAAAPSTTVFFAVPGEPARLVRELPADDGANPTGSETDAALEAALRAAVQGTPQDPDHVTLWPEGAEVRGVGRDAGAVTVDLAAGSLPDTGAEMAVQQLVHTAQSALSETGDTEAAASLSLTVTVDGSAASAEGVDLTAPVAAMDPLQAWSLIQLDTPAESAQTSGPVVLSGVAAAFEAELLYSVTEQGELVDEGIISTGECCSFQPFEQQLDLDAGTYVVEVSEPDVSDGEGFAPAFESRTVTVG